MSQCNISYIPEYLHENEKPLIPHFSMSEKLFWRLGKKSSFAPYSDISLYDVSCNRSGDDANILSHQEDVLWNIDPDKPFQKYQSEVVTLSIRKIYPESPTIKQIIDEPPTTGLLVVMTLIHHPLPCNYAHSMFVFDIANGTRVTKENYEGTFKTKPYKRLRKICKDILNKAVLQNEITF